MINFPSSGTSRHLREAPFESSFSLSRESKHAQSSEQSSKLGVPFNETSGNAWRLLDKSGEPLMLAAPDGTLRYANRAAHLAFGYEWKESVAKGAATSTHKSTKAGKGEGLVGQDWLRWVHPADETLLQETLDRLRRQPEGHATIEIRLRYGGGNAFVVGNAAWRWFSVTVTNLLDEDKTWMLQAHDISTRRETEESLLRSATHFAEVQRLACIGHWEWELNTGRVRWSEELFHIFDLHLGETEVTYDLIESRIHPHDRGGARLAVEFSVRERKTLDRHFRIERPSGAIRTIHVRARPVVGAAGQITHLSGTVQDVTEAMQSEQDLRASEARFRRIADSNIIGIMSWNAGGEITEANDAFLRIVGYTRSELWEGLMRPDVLTPPEFRDADARAVQELAERGACTPYEKEYLRKDGTRVPVLVGAAYLEPGTGHDLGICFVLDMSGPQAAEAALRDSETRYRHLVNASPDAILVHAAGEILFANEAAARLVGAVSATELIGRTILEFVDPRDRNRVAERLQRLGYGVEHDEVLNENAAERIAGAALARVLRLDGQSVEVEATSSRMHYQRRPAIQSLLRDVSQREKAARELRRTEEQLRLLIENVPDAIAILNRQSSLLYLGSAVENLTGYPPEAFAGEELWDYIHEDDRERMRRFLREILEAPAIAPSRSIEYRLRHKDGSWRVLEATCKTLPPGSLYDGILVATRDTTRRREVENRLLQVSRELQSIYDAFPDMYLRLSVEGFILAYHAADVSRFLLPPEQFFGRRVQQVLPEPAASIVARAVEKVAQRREPVQIEYEISSVGGTRRYEARLQPLLDDQIVAIVRDMTIEH
jgi:PAS domain S-box-containing protein